MNAVTRLWFVCCADGDLCCFSGEYGAEHFTNRADADRVCAELNAKKLEWISDGVRIHPDPHRVVEFVAKEA